MDYWETKLRQDASLLTSLTYFDPRYMSLARPHPIWWTAGANPYEVAETVIQSRMLSRRYRTNQLTSRWSEDCSNRCPASICQSGGETLEHLLLCCPAYAHVRLGLLEKWSRVLNPSVQLLLNTALTKPSSYFVQFILDASVLPETQSLIRSAGEKILCQIFGLTRSWCYSIHRERIRLINLSKMG